MSVSPAKRPHLELPYKIEHTQFLNEDNIQKIVKNPSLNVPKWKLSNGREMPAIALGTCLGFDENGVVLSKNKELRDIVLKAIDVGYRHFDSASMYLNEDELGEAIKMKVDAKVVSREHLFISSKLWNTHHKREEVEPAIRETLNKLGLKYVDLYLMHWPVALNADYNMSDTDFMETWKGMEDVKKLGLARAIGLSNFNKEQLERVIKEGAVKPVALQIEVHPQMLQEELLNFAKTEDIVVMGTSPLGSLVMRFGTHIAGPKKDDPVLAKIAKKNKKTAAQIFLRWLVDRNVVPLPKTLNPDRLKENFNIFDFKLKKSHIEKISALHLTYSSHRINLPSFWQTHPYYPFEKIEQPIADPFKAIYGKQASGSETKASSTSGTQALLESGNQASSATEIQASSATEIHASSVTEIQASSVTEIQALLESGNQASSASGTQGSSAAKTQAPSAPETEASATEPKVSAAAATQVSTAAVTQVSAAAGTQVSAAAGTQVSAAAGTQVSAAAGTQVSAAAGTQVSAAAAGTQVSAAAGTQVSAAAGTQVSAAAGTQTCSAAETKASAAAEIEAASDSKTEATSASVSKASS